MATRNFFIALLISCLLLFEASTAADDICQPFLSPPSAQSTCNKPRWSQYGETVASVPDQSGLSYLALRGPRGIFISRRDDTLYVADAGNHRVMKYTLGSDVGEIVAGGNGPGSAPKQLENATDVYVDYEGNVFVADTNNKRLQMWAPNATEGKNIAYTSNNVVNTVAGNSKYWKEVYVSMGVRLMKYSRTSGPADGSYVGLSSELPSGMIVDQCDTVYVTRGGPFNDGKLSKFTSDNITEQILLSGLSIPSDVILDECGHLFVVEAGKHRVVRYSTRLGGAVEVVINIRGMSGSDSEHLNSPRSLAFDSKWNLYVSDTENHRVQKFEFRGGDMWC